MIVELIWSEITKNENGFPVEQYHSIQAYGKEKSATRSEVYEAMRAGVDVKTVLEVRQEDWEQTRHLVDGKPEYARKVKLSGCEYRIVSGYKKGKATIELTCE